MLDELFERVKSVDEEVKYTVKVSMVSFFLCVKYPYFEVILYLFANSTNISSRWKYTWRK